MNKIMKNPIFTFILGAIICGATGVIASNLIASNVSYTPEDSTWGVNNVEAAIDSLKLSKTESNYSTEEKVVGTWIDGKPLYQKTYTGTIPNRNWTLLFSLTDIDHIISSDGYAVKKEDGAAYAIGSEYFNITWNDKNINGINWFALCNDGSYFYGGTYNITIQYTKTTD